MPYRNNRSFDAGADRRNIPWDAAVSGRFPPFPEEGNQLLARDALLSHKVLETRSSLNRRSRVTIVRIVVVQRTTVARVANANIVGVPGVGSPKPNKPAPWSRVVDSLRLIRLLSARPVLLIIAPVGFEPGFRKVLGVRGKFRPELASLI